MCSISGFGGADDKEEQVSILARSIILSAVSALLDKFVGIDARPKNAGKYRKNCYFVRMRDVGALSLHCPLFAGDLGAV